MVEVTGAEPADPEIKQREITQNAVEKFRGERAIGWRQITGSQKRLQDCVGKFLSAAPFRQGGESDGA